MPFIYSHNIIARRVRDSLDIPLLFNEEAAFFMGAQGPDPYFFLRAWPPDAAEGNLIAANMHTGDVRALFSTLMSSAVSDCERAYVAGFMCHYALDTCAHPYIMAVTCHKHHTPFEAQLDMAYIDELDIKLSPAGALIPWDRRSVNAVDALMAVFGRSGLYRKAFRRARLSARALYDPSGIKGRLLGRLGVYCFGPVRELAPDMLNLAHAPWRPEWLTEPRNESYLELCDMAVKDAVGYISSYLAGEPLTLDKSFATGRSGEIGEPSSSFSCRVCEHD